MSPDASWKACVYEVTPHSNLALVAPKPSLILGLVTVKVPPLGFLLVSPFLMDNLSCVSLDVTNVPSAAGMKQGCVDEK